MIIHPLNFNEWRDYETRIEALSVKQEFQNIYDLVNGNIDASNIKDGSITSAKLADGAVTGAKLSSVPATKITGKLSASQLPASTIYNTGGELTGSLVFQSGVVFLKSLTNAALTLLEAGTGTSKVTLSVNPGGDVLTITKGSTVLLTVSTSGELKPAKLVIPVGEDLW